MVAQVFVGDQDDACAAVCHLAAVEPAQPALDKRVGVVGGERIGHRPIAGLRVRIAAGVGEVQLGDGSQMRVVDAAKQVSGKAGDYQVEGAKTFGTLNFGGSTATTVSFIVRGI